MKECYWVSQPRWSWYNTPLWNCYATRLQINILRSYKHYGLNKVGGLTKADFDAHIEVHWIYLTHEEYVMWKLSNYSTNGQLDIVELRKGIIYS